MSRYAQAVIERWNRYSRRRQEALVGEVEPHISAARRLAYLLYGDWFAADAALGRAVRRLVPPWRRWWHRGVGIDTLLGDDLVRGYVAGRGDRRGSLRRLVGPRTEVTRAYADIIAVEPLLLNTLEELTTRQRAVLVCRHYRGIDQAVTAGLVGCSEFDVATELMTVTGIVTTALDRSRTVRRDEPVVLAGEWIEESETASGRR